MNSSVPETAIFVLHKTSRTKCGLFLQESPAVAKEDALKPIYSSFHYWPSRSSKVNDFFMSFKSQ